MPRESGSDPVLSCAEAARLESRLLGHDPDREWEAMNRAGQGMAAGIEMDFREIGGLPRSARLLVLVGKGHNGGDALIAARGLLQDRPEATAAVLAVFGERTLRPLARRAWRELCEAAPRQVEVLGSLPEPDTDFTVLIDGIFGFSFRPPLDARTRRAFDRINRLAIRMRASVDLPSGLGDRAAIRADFTYATGIVKEPVLAPEHQETVGRLRYVDLGFFAEGEPGRPAKTRILTSTVLDPLRVWRDPLGDKRTHGHLFVLGGSRNYPGAILMTVEAALRSGVGLVSAFVPESLVPAFAARAPEAIWIGWPETPEGGLALEGRRLLLGRWKQASALALGPGLGREPESLALVQEIVSESLVPLVIDADALQPGIVRAGTAPRILTPHAGEAKRLGDPSATSRRQKPETVLVRKGPLTWVEQGSVHHASPFGGPVLSRGGSGDILTGLAGGLLAQAPKGLLTAACRAVVWQGMAADCLAQQRGATAVKITQMLDFLPDALRG